MKLDQHYVDPRLVALYEIENPRGLDTDFYIQLATELNAKLIVDLGCGTGLLTRELAQAGHQVILRLKVETRISWPGKGGIIKVQQGYDFYCLSPVMIAAQKYFGSIPT